MDSPVFKSLRIAPTTQQGGTQTIQQSIYLTHNNPCGANTLIFQKMGLTQIRYIDLKNYMNEILQSEEMTLLFEKIRILGTEYIYNPSDLQKNYAFLYAIQQWGQASIQNLSVPVNYYKGYNFRLNVFDGSGSILYDSYYPDVKVVEYDETTGLYSLSRIDFLPSCYPFIEFDKTVEIYKIDVNNDKIPFIGFDYLPLLFSNFPRNQNSTPEATMAIASLLVDSANTRSFGIPKFGFSARCNLSGFGGITYNCAHYIDINTAPDEDGQTTLVESIFFRLSLEEDTYYIDLSMVNQFNDEQKFELLQVYKNKDINKLKNLVMTFQEPTNIIGSD